MSATLLFMVRGLAASALLVALSACVVTPTAPPPRCILVSGPPPAPIHEERTPPPAPALPPAPTAAWVAGYWHWTGLQYAWIPGHWEAAPPVGAAWHAPTYLQANGSFFYEPGAWTKPAAANPAPNPAPNPPTGTQPPSYEAFH